MQWCILPFPYPKTPKMEGVMEKMISFEELLGLSCEKEEENQEKKVINLRTEEILPEHHALLFEVFTRG